MELELKDYFKIIGRRWWFIFLFVVFCCLPVSLYEYYTIQPEYEASTKLIVTNTSRDIAQARLDTNEISSNIMIINTYKEIIKSPAIMDKVVNGHPEIDRTAQNLIDNVKIVASSNSQVMNISIIDLSQEKAVQIVNAVSEVFKREIPAIMSVDNVTILSEAKVSNHPEPVSSNLLIKGLIVFVISFIIATGIIFLREYLDDTIKSEEDVRNHLGRATLAMVAKVKSSEWKSTPDYSLNKVGIESIQQGINHQT
ncbi:YveK family protein [Cohnella endophytica]|nr:Wzz/FepE/Etk N-terminal domain-containing protein [Cohnella endophytica]